jgi:tetratricopeptide (TPR) repeat protein
VAKLLAPVWRWSCNHPRLYVAIALSACGVGVGAGLVVLRWRAEQLPAAERALRAGSFAEARLRLDRCLGWSPADADALCLAARLERVEGNYDAAEALLEKCQSRHGSTRLGTLEYCLLQAQSGDLSQERTLIGLAEADPEQAPWIWEAMARARMDTMQCRPAILCLDAWLKLQPECARAVEWRARMLEQILRFDDALATYERALHLEPERWLARLRLVDLLLSKEKVREASPHITVLLNQHPEHSDVRLVAGLRTTFESDPEKAREWFSSSLEANPNNFRALVQLGKLDLERGRPADAEGWLARAVRVHPYDIQTHFNLAKCYAQLPGRQKDAALHQARFESLSKHNKRLNELLNTKETATSTDPKILTEIGSRFLAVGQDRLAVTWLRKALRVNAEYGPAHAALAEHFERAGQGEEAAAHRARAGGATLDPHKTTALEAGDCLRPRHGWDRITF